MRTVIAVVIMLVASLMVSGAAGGQIVPIDDEPGAEAPGLGDIVPRPEPGPAPEDAGDRGGWAQLLLGAAIMAGAAIFLVRLVRMADDAPPPDGVGP